MTTYRIGPFATTRIETWLRTVFGLTFLVGLGEPILSSLARWGSPAMLYRSTRLWSSLTTRFLSMRVGISGLENVDPHQSYVVAPLHEGFADPLLLVRLPLRLRYAVRDELFEWRSLGRFLRLSDQISVGTSPKDRSRRKIVSRVRDAIAAGESVVVFPQGSLLGIEVAFNKGPFVVADRLSVPLLPVVITGTHRVWEHPFSPTLRYGQTVELRVLPPITMGEAVANMDTTERTMKELALAAEPPVRRFDPARDGFWDDYEYEIDPLFPDVYSIVKRHRQEKANSVIRVAGQ